MSSEELRKQWQKYLQLATLNYSTTYNTSVGCESSWTFYGLVPYNILDLKLGIKPKTGLITTTDFTKKVFRRTQTLCDKAKKNVTQSYITYKEFYNKKNESLTFAKKV